MSCLIAGRYQVCGCVYFLLPLDTRSVVVSIHTSTCFRFLFLPPPPPSSFLSPSYVNKLTVSLFYFVAGPMCSAS